MRSKMIRELIVARGIKDRKVIHAMKRVPRHLFVEPALASRAYGNFSLPIGYAQTISSPYTVAFMTEKLELNNEDIVLELGTGSGYQTAILAEIAKKVYSVERIRNLGIKARKLLSRLGYYNIVLRICDGSKGWPDDISFNAIIVTASAPFVPEPLIEQLSEGGRLIIPVGKRDGQRLFIWRKEGQKITKQETIDCNFVKLIGNYAWDR